jgi:hypothetical protein
MRISALSWSRYRSFRDRQRVKIPPITLIIGRNGSGKSVISRLLVLLASGIARDAADPLNLVAGGVEHAATYQDIVYQKGRLPFSLGLEVQGENTCYEFETTLRHISETRTLVVEAFVLTRGGNLLFQANLFDDGQLTSPEPHYKLSGGIEADDKIIHFAGLLPQTDPFDGELRAELDRAFAAFRQALPMPSYLGPFRVEASRQNRPPSQKVTTLGPRGEHAIELLAEDKIRFGGQMVESVSGWFSDVLGQGISLDLQEDQTRVFVTDPLNHTEVSLADTGAGFTQVLPVAVQHFAFRQSRIASSVLIVEQPELHLHPAAHGAVMDLVLESITQDGQKSKPTCLIETHSEQLIMRLRRRISEGFDWSQVALWSLNHTESDEADADVVPLKVIKFDQNGSPETWPVGVFEEAFKDLTVMRRAARERDR